MTDLEGGAWRPISTAPGEETMVWLFQPHDMGGFMFAGLQLKDGTWINNLDREDQKPTHWMPLPPPPQGEPA